MTTHVIIHDNFLISLLSCPLVFTTRPPKSLSNGEIDDVQVPRHLCSGLYRPTHLCGRNLFNNQQLIPNAKLNNQQLIPNAKYIISSSDFAIRHSIRRTIRRTLAYLSPTATETATAPATATATASATETATAPATATQQHSNSNTSTATVTHHQQQQQ